MAILIAYSTDNSIAARIRKGDFDQMRTDVESYTSLGNVYLITQDHKDYSGHFERVRHLPCGFNVSRPTRWILFYLKSFLVLQRLANRVGVVRAYSVGNFVPAIICRLYRKPMVVSYEYDWSDQMRVGRQYLSNISRWIEGFVLRSSSVVVALTRRLSDKATKKGARRVVLIPNGVDPRLIPDVPNSERERIRNELGLGSGKIVLYVGRLHKIKRIDDLIRAMSEMRKRYPNVRLVVVGDGEERPRLKRLCQELGLANHVVFTGSVPLSRVYLLMKLADAFVLPSLMEGNPRVLIEAMHCGLPIVGTDVIGINDLIEDGRNGLLAEPCDPRALAEAIELVLEDSGLARRLAENARQEAVRTYDAETLLKRNVRLVALLNEKVCGKRSFNRTDLEVEESFPWTRKEKEGAEGLRDLLGRVHHEEYQRKWVSLRLGFAFMKNIE